MEAEHNVRPPEPGRPRNSTQIISIVVGFGLCILGAAGMLWPAIAGLHFHFFSALIIFAAGCILLYTGGFKDNPRSSYITCLVFGIWFGLLALANFLFAKPGMPSIGWQVYDPHLVKIIPGFIEIGRADQILCTVLSIVLLAGALDWWRRHHERRGRHFRIFHPSEYGRRRRHNIPIRH